MFEFGFYYSQAIVWKHIKENYIDIDALIFLEDAQSSLIGVAKS